MIINGLHNILTVNGIIGLLNKLYIKRLTFLDILTSRNKFSFLLIELVCWSDNKRQRGFIYLSMFLHWSVTN